MTTGHLCHHREQDQWLKQLYSRWRWNDIALWANFRPSIIGDAWIDAGLERHLIVADVPRPRGDPSRTSVNKIAQSTQRRR
jgi:hypothetical protein